MWLIVEPGERVWQQVVDFLVAPNYADERTQDWPLASWKAAASAALLYIIAVPVAKRFMRDRKPLNVRPFTMAHNLFMTALSLYMVIETLTQQYYCEGWDRKGIQPWGSMAKPGTSFSPHCYRLARILWIHYLSKVYEFVDTFIMIAKKNMHQVSFLHIYHHTTTMLCWWTSIKFAPGGDAYFICLVNSWVHVVMYSYYFVASTGLVHIPSIFKQWITIMQMIQFSAFFSQAMFGVLVATYYRPRITMVLVLWQAVVFTVLFGNFFWHTYIKKRRVDGISAATGSKTPSLGVQGDIKVQDGKTQGGSKMLESTKPLTAKLPKGRKMQSEEAVGTFREPLLK